MKIIIKERKKKKKTRTDLRSSLLLYILFLFLFFPVCFGFDHHQFVHHRFDHHRQQEEILTIAKIKKPKHSSDILVISRVVVVVFLTIFFKFCFNQ